MGRVVFYAEFVTSYLNIRNGLLLEVWPMGLCATRTSRGRSGCGSGSPCTRRYKLYHDGRFYDIAADWEEKSPSTLCTDSLDAAKARKLLQTVPGEVPAPRFGNWRGGTPPGAE